MLYDPKQKDKPIPSVGLIDSHSHLLSMSAKKIDPDLALRDFFDAGAAMALDVGVNLEGWETRLAFHERFPSLRFSAGVHPNEAHRHEAWNAAKLRAQLDHPLCIALGEIGLDWYRGVDFKAPQEAVFNAQLQIAMERDLPVIIHDRDADEDILANLKEVGWKGRGVFHCFSSNWEFAQKILDLGFYISFAGNITYPHTDGIRRTAFFVPQDRYLVETDSPFLTPVPLRGRVNQPLYAAHTAAFVAELKGLEPEQVLQQTADNFRRLFAL